MSEHHYETARACEACGTTAEFGCLNALDSKFMDPRAAAFITEIMAVCGKHGLAISHEDQHGAFIIVPIDSDTIDWLCHAGVKLPPVPAAKPSRLAAGL